MPILNSVRNKEWVVYAKPPFGGASQVLKYLAGYTHRIAISNRRIVSFDGERVTFLYRDRRASNVQRAMALPVCEFLRRFLLHIPPARFVRIRYYGFMANRTRAAALTQARALIRRPIELPLPRDPLLPPRCPRCGEGTLRVVESLRPLQRVMQFEDTS